MEDFIVHAQARELQGKGASRRLRRLGLVPAILYGGKSGPVNLQVEHQPLLHHLEHEAFFSHILTIKTPDGEERAVLKDVQRHPAKPTVLHLDFLRVVAGQALRMNVPLHFINVGGSPASKQGGVVEHLSNEVEVLCLPKDLPEFIEVDLATLEMDQTVHLSAITLPKGVKLTALMHDDDAAVAVAHRPRAAVETDDEDASAAAEEADADEGDDN